jgi:hypothetical protein
MSGTDRPAALTTALPRHLTVADVDFMGVLDSEKE